MTKEEVQREVQLMTLRLDEIRKEEIELTTALVSFRLNCQHEAEENTGHVVRCKFCGIPLGWGCNGPKGYCEYNDSSEYCVYCGAHENNT